MPVLIPLAAAAVGAGISAVSSNVQNKSNQQAATNAQNSAQAAQAQAQATANAQQQQNLSSALARQQAYKQSNPNPIYGQQPIQGPPQLGAAPGAGGTIGGGQIQQPQPSGVAGMGPPQPQGQPGMQQPPPMGEQKIPAQQLSAIIQLLSAAHGNAQRAGQIAAQSPVAQ